MTAPHIDVPADLNLVDDDGLNLAPVPADAVPAVGDRLVVGTPVAWSWAEVVAVEDGWLHLRLMGAQEARRSPEGGLT